MIAHLSQRSAIQ